MTNKYTYLASRNMCTHTNTTNVSSLVEKLDQDIDLLTIHDKVIRIRNLKENIKGLKLWSFDIEQIKDDPKILSMINSV